MKEKCIKLLVQIAVRNVKSHSNQKKIDLFIAKTVFKNTENHEAITDVIKNS